MPISRRKPRRWSSNPREAAAAAAARTALAEIQGAVSGGRALCRCPGRSAGERGRRGAEVLAANAETGVASLPALREAFPEAARARWPPSGPRRAAAGWGPFWNASSTSARWSRGEGDDPDAVLSRAGAAVDARVASTRRCRKSPACPRPPLPRCRTGPGPARARVEAQDAIDQLTQTLHDELRGRCHDALDAR